MPTADAGREATRSTGTARWPRSPGRSCSTWACAALPQIAAALIDAGRARLASRPRSSKRARCRRSAPSARRSRRSPRPRAREDVRAPGDHGRRRRRGARRASSPGCRRGRCAGRTVAVTRARAQASGLARGSRTLGASVVEAPVIRVRQRSTPSPPLDPAPYDLICLTSANGVAGLFERLDDGASRARRARAGRRADRRDRRRHRARARRARHRRRRGARALRRRVARRGARRDPRRRAR